MALEGPMFVFRLAHPIRVQIVLAGDPMPGIAYRMFHAVPRGSRSTPALELLPAGPVIGLHIVPLAAQVVQPRLIPVLVRRAKLFVVAAGGRHGFPPSLMYRD